MKNSIKKRITKRTIDANPPREKDFIIWDDQISGFGLRIKPSGTKSYFIQYRNEQGVSRRYTLGQHGKLTPDTARDLAVQYSGNIASGKDPAEDRKLKRREMTVSELCDLYIKEGCNDKKPSTIYADKGRIERHIKKLLGNKKISALTRTDVARMRDDIVAGKTKADIKTGTRGRAIVKGGKGVARQSVSLLSAIYTFAIGRDLVTDNPCRGVKKPPANSNMRFLSEQEFAELGDLLAEAQNSGEHISVINALRLLIFTGCRKSEITTLKWDYIDWNNACLKLPDSKTGQKVVRLAPAALEILQNQPRLEGNDYVFHGCKEGHYFVGIGKAWGRIRKRRENLSDVRIHDLRHSYASAGLASGLSLALIGKLLAHKSPATTARYAHLSDDPAKSAADLIASRISNAIQKSDKDTVVKIHARK